MNFLEHPIVPLLGRLMMTYIFATSGIGKIFGWSGNVAYMNTRHLPLIPVLLAAAMVIEVAGSGGFGGGGRGGRAAGVMFLYRADGAAVGPAGFASQGTEGWIPESAF